MDQLIIELILGLSGLALFRYKNENRRLINTISILLMVVLSSRYTMSVAPNGYVVYKIGCMGLGLAYWNRFAEKKNKKIIDYAKFVVLIMIGLYPLNSLFLRYGTVNANTFFWVFTCLTLLAVVTMSVYDKWPFLKSKTF